LIIAQRTVRDAVARIHDCRANAALNPLIDASQHLQHLKDQQTRQESGEVTMVRRRQSAAHVYPSASQIRGVCETPHIRSVALSGLLGSFGRPCQSRFGARLGPIFSLS
jgi:hypothetical protein